MRFSGDPDPLESVTFGPYGSGPFLFSYSCVNKLLTRTLKYVYFLFVATSKVYLPSENTFYQNVLFEILDNNRREISRIRTRKVRILIGGSGSEKKILRIRNTAI